MAGQWHYQHDGQNHGPATGAELKELAAAGKLLPTDLIWKEGMDKWVPARSVKGLFPAGVAATTKPGPATPTPAKPAPAKAVRSVPPPLPPPLPDDDEGDDESRRHAETRPSRRTLLIAGGSVVGLVAVTLAGLMPTVEKRSPRPAAPSRQGRRRILIWIGVAGLLALAVVVIVWQVTKQRGGETPTVAAGGDPPVVGVNRAKAEQPAAKSNDPNEPVEGPEGGAPVVRPTPPAKAGPSVSPDGGTVRPSPVDDAARLQGEWVCIREEAAGMPATPAELAAMGKTLTVNGKRFAIKRTKDGVPGGYDGEFVLTPSTTPKQFDFASVVGPPWFVGVYELSEDEFKVCYRWAGTPDEKKDRASDFKTWKGSSRVLNTFKRVAPAPPKADKRWSPLFNGKNLTGWEVDGKPNPWKADGGVLTCEGAAISRRGALLTEREFTDFNCRFEFQTSSGGKGGVVLRALPGQKSLLVMLADDAGNDGEARTGTLWWPDNGGGKGGTLPPDKPARLKPLGGWNRGVVEVQGTALRLTVNGDEVLKTDLSALPAANKTEALMRASGRFGLQNHNDKVLRFRGLEVEELPRKK